MRNESRRHLQPVREVGAPSQQFLTIHGYRRAFRVAGSGPALLLLHGVGDDSSTWEPVLASLAQRFTVIAPDMLGHGDSDKPRADYSLPAFANGIRDLLTVLDIDRVTIVGHSFGGGVAMQFAYQYPQFVERLVLVSTGGITTDVSIALRLAAMPLGSEALSMLRVPGARPALQLFGRAVGSVLGSTKFGRDAKTAVDKVVALQDPSALSAFARTLRSVVDARGQFVTMLDRRYLMESVPVQLIWGEEDFIIPVSHARIGHEAIPGSRLEVFENSGHMPHHDQPDRFVNVVEQFIDSTEPADYDQDVLHARLRAGALGDTPLRAVDAAPRGA